MSFLFLVFLFLIDVGLSIGKWITSCYFAYVGFVEQGLLGAAIYFATIWVGFLILNFLVEFITVPLGWTLEMKHGVNGRFTYKAARAEAKSRRGSKYDY